MSTPEICFNKILHYHRRKFWDQKLIKLFTVPRELIPSGHFSSSIFIGNIGSDWYGGGRPGIIEMDEVLGKYLTFQSFIVCSVVPLLVGCWPSWITSIVILVAALFIRMGGGMSLLWWVGWWWVKWDILKDSIAWCRWRGCWYLMKPQGCIYPPQWSGLRDN